MSEIVFPLNHTCLFDRDIIEFPAIVDGKTIGCRITLEEMIREFMRNTSPGTFEEHFLLLRPEIEERAKKQILAKGTKSE
jgi:hypothetical protein